MEAVREEKTSAELASHYEIHPGLIRNWKTILLKGAPDLFTGKGLKDKDQAELIEQLYKKIGQLEVELDWLKKSLDLPHRERKLCIDWNQDRVLSVTRQAELLGLSRACLYYKPVIDTDDCQQSSEKGPFFII